MQPMSVQANSICVGYGAKTIIQDLSLQASAGELTVLVGPNGCGKSTLLKSLARVLPLRSGDIQIGDLPLASTATKKIAQTLAFLPQGPIAPEGLSVRELIAQGRFPHQSLLRQWSREDAAAVDKALLQTHLTEFADRPLNQLSGGQRQRAWIAMVLAQDTPILLLDEPTAFLDLKVQVELLALLQQIAHSEGRTVIVVLHDLNVAASFADRMVMINQGKIMADGAVKAVFNSENLSKVFALETSILTDPQSGRPICIPKPVNLATGKP